MFVDWFVDLSGKGKDATTKGTRTLVILVTWSIWCERMHGFLIVKRSP
ncbi:hypothetical protein HU200_066097 [Digitaria exilis]|uniref:Uncharacterized protein n=1 Tax=Digitaria exilis TaxID=1010633 RepID=A0A835DT61_9POAL|nr:hypothetical protein HU200_066097 [Digitaria exilis]